MPSQFRVLHVDDDPGFLDLSRTVFDRHSGNFEVHTAESGGEALELMASTDFDCLVSDSVTLPDDTYFVAAARERDPDVPIVLFTAKAWDDVAAEATAADVDEYVRKAQEGDFATLVARLDSLSDDATDLSAADAAALGDWRQIDQYDWEADEELGTFVVEAVTDYVDADDASLPPLYDYVDADAIEQVVSPDSRGRRRDVHVRFRYDAFDVRVTGDGVVALRWADDGPV